MDWYALIKLLHVVSAIVWLGGGFTLMLLAIRADHMGDDEGAMQVMRWVGEIGNKLFLPASLLTFAFGFLMCWLWIGFSDLWIVIGLVGYFISFAIGSFIFKPSADRMGAEIARNGVTPSAVQFGRRIMQIAKFDYTVMLVIVSAMVLKPTLEDIDVLVGMGLVLAGGAALTLGGLRQARDGLEGEARA